MCGPFKFWIRISLHENQEFMTISWDEAEDPEEFQPKARYELAVELLSHLPNLISIDVDLDSSSWFPQVFLDRTIESDISGRGEFLTCLSLTSDTYNSRMSTRTVAELLLKLPKLQQLELCSVEVQSSDGLVLKEVIAAMEHLDYLDLDDSQCLVDDWARADWQSGLKTLALDECGQMWST